MKHLCGISLRKGIARKPSTMSLVVTHTSVWISMWNAESGGWLQRNAKIEAIRQRWSECLHSSKFDLRANMIIRQLRKSCPNSLLARELDQMAASMK